MGFLARLPIRLRVTLAFAIAMAIVLAATGVFLYVRLGSALDRTIDQSLRARSTDVGALVRQGDSLGKEGEGMTQVLDPRGAVLAATPGLGRPLLTTEEISRASREAVTIERSVPNSDEAARILATPLDTQRGQRIVVVGASLEQRGDALENLFVALLIGGPLALLLASLAGYGLAAAALRPVESMRREAEAVSAAEPGRRLSLPPARDEISRLGETLNIMLGRLESALARERRFVSDASHELRTPLSALRTELELALRRERTPEELEAALRSAAEETDRLSQLAEDLLELRVEDGLSVSVDRLRVEQALGNLVENALRHGGGTILLEARSVDGRVELHVQDEGAGFAPDFIADAFEPFSRGDPARSSRGAGLGLAIVDVIARAHGGTAHVANVDGGADVWLELPR